jgi:uncharacterized protein (TIGR02444 family)
MNDTKTRSENLQAEGWSFLLAIYAEPDVASTCLRLQDEAQVDVVMLLTVAFFVARKGRAITKSEIEEMIAICRDWREQIVLPLRGIRIRLKSGPAPAPSSASEALRSQIKAAELQSERLQFELLVQHISASTDGASSIDLEGLRKALLSVVETCSAKEAMHALNDVDLIAQAALRCS